MRKFFRLVLMLVVVAALAGGGIWYVRGRTATAAASTTAQTYTQIVAVKQGSLSSTISVVGQLEAVQSADLLFSKLSSTTKLATLAVKAGATITNGQVLATVDPTPYQSALDQATSALAASQKVYTDMTTPATALDVAKADLAIAKAQLTLKQAESALDKLVNPDLVSLQSAVASAESALAKAQADILTQQQTQSSQDQLDRLVNAVATPTTLYNRLAAENTPDSDLYYLDRKQVAFNKMMDAQDALSTYQINAQVSAAQAQTSLRKAQTALATAKEKLATAQAGGDKLELAKAQVAVQDAKVALQAAQKARTDLTTGADATDIATAKADVDKKKLAVSDAQAALAATKLTATFDGTVLKVNNSVGDLVSANTVVLTIANLKTLQVSASVDETTIRQVSAGQAAVVSFDAFPNQTFKGSVASVPLQGTLQGGIMVYAVPITLTGTEKLTLLVGMTANVKIQAGTVQNGLLVPTMALTKSNGQYQVLVPSTVDAKADPVATPVEVGLSDGTYTQITKGLNVGDQVVVQVKSSTSSTNQQGIPGGFGGGLPVGGPPGGN